MTRACAGCTACCQVVPVKELGTKPWQGCPHMLTAIHAEGPGCGVYSRRPRSCVHWRCGWIENEDWGEELRPDRCGFIVDEVFDLIEINGQERPAAQIWAMRGHEDAYTRQPAIGVILAILHELDVDVLWRLQGETESIAFRLGEGGQAEMIRSKRMPDEVLGTDAERFLRAQAILDARQRRA